MIDYTDEQLQAACQAVADSLGNPDAELVLVIVAPRERVDTPGYRRVIVMAYGMETEHVVDVLNSAADNITLIQNDENSDNVH